MKNINIALIGNPNVGKTSVFNALTGMNQHTGNYPGITVEKKTGSFKHHNHKILITDLPGVYSIAPSSKDEEVAMEVIFDKNHKNHPDLVVIVAEIENLKRNLLLFSQLKNLGLPAILCINMADQMKKKGITIDTAELEKEINAPVVLISARKNLGIDELKDAIIDYKSVTTTDFFDITTISDPHFELLKQHFGENAYKAWLSQTNVYQFDDYSNQINNIAELQKSPEEIKRISHKEIIKRYQKINTTLKTAYIKNMQIATDIRMKFDKILTHKFFGLVIFFAIMMLIFASIFELASIPMDYIEEKFDILATLIGTHLPEGKINDLITNGIIPGLSGVLMFIPQIAILFFLISILEESGYMSRVVFLMDKFMRPFGLNGKSVIPLISGTACAIPAIMSARNIENPTERLITMLITPFTTCSARIPVYIIIIELIIPDSKILGFLPLQGLVMTLMYFLGFITALLAGFILSKVIKPTHESIFIIEMPTYKLPIFKNVLLTIYEKVISYIKGAGKIILSLSIILWFLGSHGPSDTFGNAENIVKEKHTNLDDEELENQIADFKLRNSYIGILGRGVEPVFKPLGYDWKISIAVLTSFAAREVFVGNLATLYSLGEVDDDDNGKIINRMRQERYPNGTLVFSFATGVSLLLFYAFAMQCLSTVAITRKETNSWKWSLFQMFFMSTFAYIVALIAYQTLK